MLNVCKTRSACVSLNRMKYVTCLKKITELQFHFFLNQEVFINMLREQQIKEI